MFVTHAKKDSTRQSFKNSTKSSSSRTGELLYNDVWGTINKLNQDAEKYFLSAINDFSYFTHVYLLKLKSEAEIKLIELINKLKTKSIFII